MGVALPEGAGIRGIEVYLPAKRVGTAELVDSGDLTARQHEVLGVSSVPVAAEHEHPSDLMVTAARRLLDRLSVPPTSVDVVITTCGGPPEYQVRTLAARVTHEIGAVCANGFDVYQGCNSFQLQISLALALIQARQDVDNVLLVAGERWAEYSKNRVAAGIVFGDAGAAALISRGATELVPRAFHTYLDGSLHDVAGVAWGSRAFAEGADRAGDLSYSVCDQDKLVTEFIPRNIKTFQLVAEETVFAAGLTMEDIAGVHVPAGRADLMNKLVRTLGFDPERSNIPYLADQGDLATAGPYADVSRLMAEPFMTHGDHLLVLTQGTGMVWSGMVLRR